MPVGLDNLKHIVSLMMENRSFDHMLGFLRSANYPIEGLSGNESNLDSAGTPVKVSPDAVYFGDLTPDPDHSHFGVMQQLFDGASPASAAPSNAGFVKDYGSITNNVEASHHIMKCFSAANLPILSTLAQQFCVCDRWFSSVPGPTFPNRAFAHAATSIGRVDMSPVGYVGISKTIYELLDENAIGARIYYNDTTLAATFPRLLLKMNSYFATFPSFVAACADNSLPAYSFIEPRYNTLAVEDLFYTASDQHPDHDVQEGEKLIQQVFNAVWSNPDVRNSTLLVITYDEHGGLYDHVPPLPRTVNPDGKTWAGAAGNPDPPFDFTWLGVRVPAVLVSPYIPAGSIDRTLYDHTSVIATAAKLLLKNIQPAFLTQRDKNAKTFESNLSLTAARTEGISLPITIQANIAEAAPAKMVLKPLTEHQKELVRMNAYLEKQLPAGQRTNTDPNTIRTEGAAAKYIQDVMSRLQAAAPPATPPGVAPAPKV
ncbi:MAG TPA: alkaline phosphatase family protein [Candidatus Acidoferrales bacterium]|nr:alkaline phosphatase family protein [Candidatus Acidoferrales bacterium]